MVHKVIIAWRDYLEQGEIKTKIKTKTKREGKLQAKIKIRIATGLQATSN